MNITTQLKTPYGCNFQLIFGFTTQTINSEMSKEMNEIKELLKIYPQDVILLMSLTQAYMDIQDYKNAILTSRKILQINPHYSVAYRILGGALVETKEFTDAIKTYKKGILVAEKNGDLQVAKEMKVFLRRLEKN